LTTAWRAPRSVATAVLAYSFDGGLKNNSFACGEVWASTG